MTPKRERRTVATPWGQVNRIAFMQAMIDRQRRYLHTLLRARLKAHRAGNATLVDRMNDRIALARRDIGQWERQGL